MHRRDYKSETLSPPRPFPPHAAARFASTALSSSFPLFGSRTCPREKHGECIASDDHSPCVFLERTASHPRSNCTHILPLTLVLI